MKTGSKLDTHGQKENVRSTRKTLKDLQQTSTNKENLAGRLITSKEKLISTSSKPEGKRKDYEDKSVQTGESTITAADLTSDEPSADYWKKLAAKREEMLNDSYHEIDNLKGTIEALQEENSICKEMLEESRNLVEVLQEMLEEGDTHSSLANEPAEETN